MGRLRRNGNSIRRHAAVPLGLGHPATRPGHGLYDRCDCRDTTAAGTYVFTVFVNDAAGAFDSKTVTIVVSPTPTPPVLHVPGTITVNATRPSGAIVTYVVTATDTVDPNPAVCVRRDRALSFRSGRRP